ncbi:hypothetical protein DPMN_045021 [Dreissena polymorpha]|uniref:C2H2-type domain-containing protein n=1 Tax=Dreissena polymorpha TaxID=45954 RepID=A0A9D4D3I6_DREPO|nr:hypothetical protein DPMN_045021 [Dreissena polymorpha]
MLTNANHCGDREISASNDICCEIPDKLTSHDSFYSKDDGQFWCDTCGRGLQDLISLRQHVAQHIVDSIRDKNETYASQSLHAVLSSNQEPVTDGNVRTELEDSTLGMLNLCSHIVCTLS